MNLKDKFSKAVKIKGVKLQFAACGEVMIDGLPFAFGVESAGKASDKGICVSISGDAVDSGEVTFSNLQFHEMHGGKVTVVKHDFPLVKKKDGKKIYQAKFSKIPLTEFSTGAFFRKITEQEVIDRLNAQLSFRVTPHYSGSETPEVMLTVYPIEDPVMGSCVEWKKVTSDKDYFIHKFRQEKNR